MPDIYWARTHVCSNSSDGSSNSACWRVSDTRARCSGVGWVYQYVLKDSTGRMDLAELRALQDFTVRPALRPLRVWRKSRLLAASSDNAPDRHRSGSLV